MLFIKVLAACERGRLTEHNARIFSRRGGRPARTGHSSRASWNLGCGDASLPDSLVAAPLPLEVEHYSHYTATQLTPHCSQAFDTEAHIRLLPWLSPVLSPWGFIRAARARARTHTHTCTARGTLVSVAPAAPGRRHGGAIHRYPVLSSVLRPRAEMRDPRARRRHNCRPEAALDHRAEREFLPVPGLIAPILTFAASAASPCISSSSRWSRVLGLRTTLGASTGQDGRLHSRGGDSPSATTQPCSRGRCPRA